MFGCVCESVCVRERVCVRVCCVCVHVREREPMNKLAIESECEDFYSY